MGEKEHCIPGDEYAPYFKVWCRVHPPLVASTGTDNLVKVEGHVDSNQYQILENNVQESVKKLKLHQGWLF